MSTKQIYFIADLHLSESRPDITDCFIKFLQQHIQPNASALYILGDFFEAWIGDDDTSALNNSVSAQLNALSSQGIAIYFIHGNRDFLLGQKYASKSGFSILPELYTDTLFGTPILLLHGDTLCTDDIDYQKFRKKVRSPWWQYIVLSLPLWVRRRIARSAREKSKQKQQTLDSAILDVNEEEVESTFAARKVPLMIHGHTHRPFIHHYSFGTRIVLGDWYTQGSYLTFDQHGYTLHQLSFSD